MTLQCSIVAHFQQLSTAELKQVQDAVQEKLQERAAIREEKVHFCSALLLATTHFVA